MTEVTEWDNKPRYMWCWNSDENYSVKKYVVHIITQEEMEEAGYTDYPVCTSFGNCYMHCAEIEPETRLTYYELSQLLKCFGISYTWGSMSSFHNSIYTTLVEEDKKLPDDYKIRYKQGLWEEPTRETVWKWWGEEIPGSDITRFVSFMGWNIDKEAEK